MPIIEPDIEGLELIRDSFTNNPYLFGEIASEGVDLDGPSFDCGPPGVPIGCPDVIAVIGSLYADTFTIPAHWNIAGTGFFTDQIVPAPDYVLISTEVAFTFTPAVDGCVPSPTFGCGAEVHPDVTITVDFTSPAGTGSIDYFPSGIDLGNPSYAPHIDPSITSGGWGQGGTALVAPPSAVYTDPDPADPNIAYVPYLWRWADIVGATISVEVPSAGVHNISDGGPAWGLTITPYRLIRTSSAWMQVL